MKLLLADLKNIYYILLIACLALAGGCTDTAPDVPSPESADMCDLVVSLSAEITVEKDPATRAGEDIPWDKDPHPEAPVAPSEYAVDHISLYFVTGSNTVLPLSPSHIGAADNVYTYKVKINRNASFVNKNPDGSRTLSGRIVAVANYPDGVTPAEPLGDIPYPFSYIDNVKRIPMWGVTTLDGLNLVANATVDAGEIKLLRSVPKITFEMADNLKSIYKITSVVPDQSDYLSVANCVPTGGTYAATTGSLLIEGCFNGSLTVDHIAPVFYNIGSNKVVTYIAERTCPLTAADEPLSFTVTLERTDGVTSRPFTGKVYLCDYNADGTPDFVRAFSRLVRNHDYKYVISLKELEFVISFKEWIFGGKVHIELE